MEFLISAGLTAIVLLGILAFSDMNEEKRIIKHNKKIIDIFCRYGAGISRARANKNKNVTVITFDNGGKHYEIEIKEVE